MHEYWRTLSVSGTLGQKSIYQTCWTETLKSSVAIYKKIKPREGTSWYSHALAELGLDLKSGAWTLRSPQDSSDRRSCIPTLCQVYANARDPAAISASVRMSSQNPLLVPSLLSWVWSLYTILTTLGNIKSDFCWSFKGHQQIKINTDMGMRNKMPKMEIKE